MAGQARPDRGAGAGGEAQGRAIGRGQGNVEASIIRTVFWGLLYYI